MSATGVEVLAAHDGARFCFATDALALPRSTRSWRATLGSIDLFIDTLTEIR